VIESVKIEGFKSIKSQEFEFKGLTVLTGLNSTGKSSVIQSLLLLSHFNFSSTELKGYVRKFLAFEDVRNRYENSREIKIDIVAEHISSLLSIKRNEHWEINNKRDMFNFEENLFYISSNRIGQEDIASYDEDIKFGTDGLFENISYKNHIKIYMIGI